MGKSSSLSKSIPAAPLPVIVQTEQVQSAILHVRGQRVMLDRDLAEMYGVTTKALNQAVKRNPLRFPADFMFQLTPQEKDEVVTICDHLKILKFSPALPYAFTEQGVAMLSSVLNSERAVLVNVQIMRTFVKLREILATHTVLARRLDELEQRYDHQFKVVFDAIRQLMAEPKEKRKPPIGYHTERQGRMARA